MDIHSLARYDSGVDATAPLQSLYHSHEVILTHLSALAGLPALVEQLRNSRAIANAALALFRDNVHQHHRTEEEDLFPAILRSAREGEERDLVVAMTTRLAAEHVNVEQLWKAVEPSVRKAARGNCDNMDLDLISRLVRDYSQHAQFEEKHLLPLAQAILERNGDHMAAVGAAMHLRRMPDIPGYI